MNSGEPLNLAENAPKPFAEVPPLWLRLGKMNEAFFSRELPHASVSNTFFSILVATGFAVIASVISSLISGVRGFISPPPGVGPAQALRISTTLGIFLCCFEMALVPLGFYFRNFVIFILAMIFGGKGKYSHQAYLNSLYYVPLMLISGLIGFSAYLPVVGNFVLGLAILGVLLFNFLLDIRLLKAAHSLSTGRAVGALLIPLALILIPLCMIGILTLMGPMIGNVFSSINSQLGTPMP